MHAGNRMNSLTIGGIIAIALLSVALAVASKWGMGQAEEAAKQKAAAAQWESMSLACSDSVLEAENKAKDAAKRAATELKQAKAATASAEAQKRALDAQKGQKLTCDAAMAEVRKGLR